MPTESPLSPHLQDNDACMLLVFSELLHPLHLQVVPQGRPRLTHGHLRPFVVLVEGRQDKIFFPFLFLPQEQPDSVLSDSNVLFSVEKKKGIISLNIKMFPTSFLNDHTSHFQLEN